MSAIKTSAKTMSTEMDRVRWMRGLKNLPGFFRCGKASVIPVNKV